MVKKNPKGKKKKASGSDDQKVSLWVQHGIDDVFYQRDAQVNLWTVMGGIAVAALLTQMNNLVVEIQSGHWYLLLYFLTSVALITNSWVMNLWGGLVLKVQVTILHTFLLLLNFLCLSIVCLQVTNPQIFFAALGFLLLFLLLIQLYYAKSGAWVAFTSERVKGIKVYLGVYFVLMILCFGATAHLFWNPSVSAEIGWGIFALLASIGSMVMQHFGIEQERKELGIP